MALFEQAPHVPWVQKKYAARGKRPPRVEVHFSPAYVRALWEQDSGSESTTRSGHDPSSSESLLFDDVITIQSASIFVRAWLVPANELEYFHLRVEVTTSQRLARNARVILYWDGHEYTVPLRAGEMLFEDISPPDFSRLKGNLPTRRLRMSFEVEESSQNGKH